MSFSDFFSRFAAWRKQTPLSSPEELQVAFTESQQALQRSLIKEGKLLMKQLDHLREKEQQSREQQLDLQQQLSHLLERTQVSEELLSGERVAFDLSQGKRWQTFQDEAQPYLGRKASSVGLSNLPSGSVRPFKKKEEQSPQVFPLLDLKKSESQKKLKQLYDVRHLEQESDELLHYL